MEERVVLLDSYYHFLKSLIEDKGRNVLYITEWAFEKDDYSCYVVNPIVLNSYYFLFLNVSYKTPPVLPAWCKRNELKYDLYYIIIGKAGVAVAADDDAASAAAAVCAV